MVETTKHKHMDSNYQMSPGGQKYPRVKVIIQITIQHAITKPQQLASDYELGRHTLIGG